VVVAEVVVGEAVVAALNQNQEHWLIQNFLLLRKLSNQ